MRELTTVEYREVSGGLTAEEMFEGFLWGVGDGAMTGMAIAGKFGNGGGWIAGAISNLVGYVVTPFVGGAIAGIGGAIFGRETIASVLQNYRETLGS